MRSVWDYPRPPALEPCVRRVRVELGGRIVADSTSALRILETSHPPTIYIPPEDIDSRCLRPAVGSSFCEWKGIATYFDLVAGERREQAAAWTYRDPAPARPRRRVSRANGRLLAG